MNQLEILPDFIILKISKKNWRVWGKMFVVNKKIHSILLSNLGRFKERYMQPNTINLTGFGHAKMISLPISYEEFGDGVTTAHWERNSPLYNSYLTLVKYIDKRKMSHINHGFQSSRNHPYRKKFGMKSFICLNSTLNHPSQ